MRGWFGGGRDGADQGEPEVDSGPIIRRVELRGTGLRGRRALPGFRGLVTRPRPQSQAQAKLDRTRAQLREVFAPTQPVTDPKIFAGRVKVLKQLIESIEHRMSHVVIFGERGIGKTSILHILGGLAEDSDYIVLRATCGARSEFSTLFRGMLKHVPLRYHAAMSPVGDRSDGNLASLLPEGPYDARELSEVLGSVTSTRLLILLDEYDRIEDETFRQSIAELIKNLSDLAAQVHIVVAGVSSNLDELIGYIPSIRRNVIGLPVQRLGNDEVREIVRIGEEATGLKFVEDAIGAIERLGNGSPYLVRLIAYHSSMIALDEGRFEVSNADVLEGLERMVEETESRLPVLVAQRARTFDTGTDAGALAHVARLGSTPNGWFSVSSADRAAPGVAALLERLTSLGLLERRRGGDDDALHFVDEGLASYFWILATRAAMRASAPVRAVG